jgi:hypothetical protein
MYYIYRHTVLYLMYIHMHTVLMNKCQEIPFTVIVSMCLTHRYIENNDIHSSGDENQFPVRACK